MRVRRKLEDLKRFQTIATVLSKHGFGMVVDKVKAKGSSFSAKPQVRARKAMEELGGAFVKLGQMLALRPDLLPQEYCTELEKLQDHGKPISFSEIKKIIDKELSRPLETIFKKIDAKPLAVGSIAQVHKAILTTGEHVVIKVRKPGVKDIFQEDSDLLAYLAVKIKRYVKSEVIDPEMIVKEFRNYTKKELDFSSEKKHLKQFQKIKSIKVPKVYDISTESILILEFIDGKALSTHNYEKKTKRVRAQLAESLATSVMKQVFMHGYFHADPHPGNVLLLNHSNKLALVDFGIVGTVDTKTKITLTVILYALLYKDVHLLSRALLKLGFAKEEVSLDEFEYDLKHTLSKYYDAKLADINLSKLFMESIQVARTHQLSIPQKLVLLGKTLVTTESVCHQLNPDFKFVVIAKPFLKEHLPKVISSQFMLAQVKDELLDYGELVLNMPRDLKRIIAIKEGDHRTLEKMQGVISQTQKEMIRMQRNFTVGILGFLIIVVSLVTNAGTPFVFGLSIPSTILFTVGTLMLLSLMHIGNH